MDIRDEMQKVLLTLAFAKRPYKVQPRQYGHLVYTIREDLKMPHTVHVDITEDELRKAFHSQETFHNYVNEICDKIDKERMKYERNLCRCHQSKEKRIF